MSKFIFLWFEAPLQSWGADSLFSRRDTMPFPTKSGVLGLLLCSAGLSGDQSEVLAKFKTLDQTIVAYQPANGEVVSRLQDFHMVGSAYNDKDQWENLNIPKTSTGKKPKTVAGNKLTYRYYIQDGRFGVALECPDEYSNLFCESLQKPVFDIYLGRKNCAPTDFVYRGIFPTESEALHASESLAKEKGLVKTFSVWSTKHSEDDEELTLKDVPIRGGWRKVYSARKVFIEYA